MSGQRGGYGGWSWAEGWRLATGAGSGEPWRGGVLAPAAAIRSRVVSGKRADPIGNPGGRSGGSRMAEAVGAVALIAAPARWRWLWSVLAAMLGLCE